MVKATYYLNKKNDFFFKFWNLNNRTILSQQEKHKQN